MNWLLHDQTTKKEDERKRGNERNHLKLIKNNITHTQAFIFYAAEQTRKGYLHDLTHNILRWYVIKKQNIP